MTEPQRDEGSEDNPGMVTNLTIRLAVLGLLVYWCFLIFRPFVVVLVWGIVLAVALSPGYLRLEGALRGRRKLAAVVLVTLCLGAIIVPTLALSDSLLDGVRFVSEHIERTEGGELAIPPAPTKVEEWPVVGTWFYETWSTASTSLETVLARFRPQLIAVGAWLVGIAKQAALGVLMTAVSLVIAAALLTRRESAIGTARAIGARLGGEQGVEYVRLAGRAIMTVARGVVGVAAIQAALAALGLAVAGVPGAGLWALLVLILAVAQLPPILVLGPAILYLVATGAGATVVILFTIWSLVVSISDMALKPLLMGRGLEIPVPVILIGAIGGLLLHGFIGLFVGAVVFSTGYRLSSRWVTQSTAVGADPPKTA